MGIKAGLRASYAWVTQEMLDAVNRWVWHVFVGAAHRAADATACAILHLLNSAAIEEREAGQLKLLTTCPSSLQPRVAPAAVHSLLHALGGAGAPQVWSHRCATQRCCCGLTPLHASCLPGTYQRRACDRPPRLRIPGLQAGTFLTTSARATWPPSRSSCRCDGCCRCGRCLAASGIYLRVMLSQQ